MFRYTVKTDENIVADTLVSSPLNIYHLTFLLTLLWFSLNPLIPLWRLGHPEVLQAAEHVPTNPIVKIVSAVSTAVSSEKEESDCFWTGFLIMTMERASHIENL